MEKREEIYIFFNSRLTKWFAWESIKRLFEHEERTFLFISCAFFLKKKNKSSKKNPSPLSSNQLDGPFAQSVESELKDVEVPKGLKKKRKKKKAIGHALNCYRITGPWLSLAYSLLASGLINGQDFIFFCVGDKKKKILERLLCIKNLGLRK